MSTLTATRWLLSNLAMLERGNVERKFCVFEDSGWTVYKISTTGQIIRPGRPTQVPRYPGTQEPRNCVPVQLRI